MSNFQLDFNRSNGIRVRNVLDHFVKPVTDGQYQSLLENDLIFESCTLEDIENTLFLGVPAVQDAMLEAITSTSVRLKNTMAAFVRSLNKVTTPAGVTVSSDVEISSPRKSGMVAVMTAKMNLSDGQSISVVFHAPDNDPLKINPSDTLIAFRFQLNSRDVTHVVASSGGKDLSLAQATMALSNLVEKNSEKFKAKQGEKVSQQKEINDSERQAIEIESTLAAISNDIDEVNDSINTVNSAVVSLQKRIDRENATQEKLRAELAALTPNPATTIDDVPSAGGNSDPTQGVGGVDDTQGQSELQSTFTELANLNGALARDIARSLKVIGQVDSGTDRGMDRSLFVSSIVNKLKTQFKNGNQDVVDAALAHIKAFNAFNGKPAITDRNGVWKLHSDIQNPPAEPTPEPTQIDKMLKPRDSFTFNGDVYIYDEAISDTRIKVIDRDSGDSFLTSTNEPMINQLAQEGIKFEGVTYPKSEAELDAELEAELSTAIEAFKQLDLSQYIQSNGSLNFDGQDELQAALGKAGFSNTPETINGIQQSKAQYFTRLINNMLRNGELTSSTSEQKGTAANPANVGDTINIGDDAYVIKNIVNPFNIRVATVGGSNAIEMGMSDKELTELGIVVAGVNDADATRQKEIDTQVRKQEEQEISANNAIVREAATAELDTVTKSELDFIKQYGIPTKTGKDYVFKFFDPSDEHFNSSINVERNSGITVTEAEIMHDADSNKYYFGAAYADMDLVKGLSVFDRPKYTLGQAKAIAYKVAVIALKRQGYVVGQDVSPQTTANSPLDAAVESLKAMAAYSTQTVPSDIADKNTFFTNWLNDINAAITTIMEADKADEYDPLMNEVADLYTTLSKETR